MYRANPEIFITETARIILGVKVSVSSENISYKPKEGSNAQSLAERFDVLRADSMTAETPERGLYDVTPCDSKVERDFASEADKETTLFAHAKLNSILYIPTPGGRYNPDWGIFMKDGRILVAETKGATDSSQLSFSEKAKILCAYKFFKAAGIEYTVEDSFDSLMLKVKG